MRFIGLKETAEITKQLKGHHTWGPRVEIRYSVNNETAEVEVYGSEYMTDNEFVERKKIWKYAGSTWRPMTQKEIKEYVLYALKQNEDK